MKTFGEVFFLIRNRTHGSSLAVAEVDPGQHVDVTQKFGRSHSGAEGALCERQGAVGVTRAKHASREAAVGHTKICDRRGWSHTSSATAMPNEYGNTKPIRFAQI